MARIHKLYQEALGPPSKSPGAPGSAAPQSATSIPTDKVRFSHRFLSYDVIRSCSLWACVVRFLGSFVNCVVAVVVVIGCVVESGAGS